MGLSRFMAIRTGATYGTIGSVVHNFQVPSCCNATDTTAKSAPSALAHTRARPVAGAVVMVNAKYSAAVSASDTHDSRLHSTACAAVKSPALLLEPQSNAASINFTHAREVFSPNPTTRKSVTTNSWLEISGIPPLTSACTTRGTTGAGSGYR